MTDSIKLPDLILAKAEDRVDRFKPLEDYGIIGNLETCALIAKDGSIDWCCFPHMESSSIFASILDSSIGGYFSVHPSGNFSSSQEYIEKSNVLKTFFQTDEGQAVVVDFMPVVNKLSRGKGSAIYRRISCIAGNVEMGVDFKPRFDYGRMATTMKASGRGFKAVAGDEVLYLYSEVPLGIYKDDSVQGTFNVREGDSVWVVAGYGEPIDGGSEAYEDILSSTIRFWQEWAHDCDPSMCVFEGPWHDLVTRSALVLKLLTHRETGAICAAATTSLPEEIGGIRNWDYRFNWIRDASFTVQALFNLGHIKEARDHLRWFMDICSFTDEPSGIKIMYGLHGETDLEEMQLNHLSGYRNSAPVRIGNAAADQRQLDIYGELVNAIYETSRHGEQIKPDIWKLILKLVEYVTEIWKEKDAGIWEVRGGERHFVYSKLMCWVALDRGIRIAETSGFSAPVKRWRAVSENIKKTILQKGFSRELNSFVQSFDSEVLDATSLLIPILGMLPFDDPRVQGTIDAAINKLTGREGLIYRYKGEDGLPGREGVFLLCTFWLVDALILADRVEEGEHLFRQALKHVGPLGLLSEEIDTDTGRQIGNIPQAFSHIGLINSALYLGRAKGKKQMGPEPLGTCRCPAGID